MTMELWEVLCSTCRCKQENVANILCIKFGLQIYFVEIIVCNIKFTSAASITVALVTERNT